MRVDFYESIIYNKSYVSLVRLSV